MKGSMIRLLLATNSAMHHRGIGGPPGGQAGISVFGQDLVDQPHQHLRLFMMYPVGRIQQIDEAHSLALIDAWFRHRALKVSILL